MNNPEANAAQPQPEGEFANFDDRGIRQGTGIARSENRRGQRASARCGRDTGSAPFKEIFHAEKDGARQAAFRLKAVDDVSFKIYPGETLGIVGESGCGKSTMGRAILKLHQPTAGQIFFKGEDIANYKQKEMRPLRTKMQIVFQDPYSSLPPRSTVGDILSEPVKVHKLVPKEQIKDYVLDLMERCGLRDYYYERYPHEFSAVNASVSVSRARFP